MIVNGAVQGSVVVENSGGGDHDQTAATSPFFGRKERRFLIGAALVLLLVVGVIVGVTILVTTFNSKERPPQTMTAIPAPSKACILDIKIGCRPDDNFLGDRCDIIPMCNQISEQRAFEMSFRYNGGDCSQSRNSQALSGLFQCNNFNGGPPSKEGVVAWIEAFELGGGEIYFSGFVTVGEVFTLFAEDTFSPNQNITIYDSKGETDRDSVVRPENIMQTIRYHSAQETSFYLSNKFGSAQLVEFVNEYQGRVTCFITAILALDIMIPIFTNGDNSVRLTSLKILTNILGIIDKTEEVNGFVIDGMVDEPIPIEITLDLSVRQRSYTFSTTIVGETVTGADECNGDNFVEFAA
jgi:hypothetical protein